MIIFFKQSLPSEINQMRMFDAIESTAQLINKEQRKNHRRAQFDQFLLIVAQYAMNITFDIHLFHPLLFLSLCLGFVVVVLFNCCAVNGPSQQNPKRTQINI